MYRQHTLNSLRHHADRIRGRRAVVGLDGFVDLIVTPVGLRRAQGEDFTPIGNMTDFGQRIAAAAGMSTNIELYPRLEKLGGNGPIMANALLAAGADVTYIGALGHPQVHPVFADMARRARTVSLSAAAHTTAIEFTDGKLMLGTMRSLDEITYARICETMGEDTFIAELAGAGLVALVNWTMIPNMTAIFNALVDRVLPRLPAAAERIFFFDLADPEKRSADDLRAALTAITRFEAFGRVTLGLNLKEAHQVSAALGCTATADDEAGLRAMAAEIRAKLALATVVVHPRESAACATAQGTWWVPGPYTPQPLITTGAGDHFNAGFTTGQVIGLAPEACLTVGVCTSGHYVRTGESPSLAAIETFLANWR
jgi:sugar/nucleoside kinase (ribokinase family)